MNTRGVSNNALNQVFAWILLSTMCVAIVQPLARATKVPESSVYADWLLDRGASDVDVTLTEALQSAVSGGHRSLDSLVREFARQVASRDGLEAARVAWATDSETFTENDLAELILADLRALSPNEPGQTARLSPPESMALPAPSRDVKAQNHKRPVPRAELPVLVVEAEPNLAVGLTTSIQSLGP